MESLSWANVAAWPKQPTSNPLQYSLRTGRRLKPPKAAATSQCNARHCENDTSRCTLLQCAVKIQKQFSGIQADNARMLKSCDNLLHDIKQLRDDIFRECETDHFQDEEMTASRIALEKTLRPKPQEVDCFCAACELAAERRHYDLLGQRFDAAQRRHTALKQYRRANDKETLKRISSSFTTGKYFTPVGSRQAKGVTALRPTLQMQTSYDFAALTTNSMCTRPLKAAWKDKPKPQARC